MAKTIQMTKDYDRSGREWQFLMGCWGYDDTAKTNPCHIKIYQNQIVVVVVIPGVTTVGTDYTNISNTKTEIEIYPLYRGDSVYSALTLTLTLTLALTMLM